MSSVIVIFTPREPVAAAEQAALVVDAKRGPRASEKHRNVARMHCRIAMRRMGALLAALALASCTSTAITTRQDTVLHIAQSAEPGSLDPLLLTGAPAEEIGSLLYSYLLRVDDRGTLVPDLALRVPSIANGGISADGMTIVYRLRSGVRWHDGAPFSAADVIATYRAVMDPRNPVPTRLGFDRIRRIDAPSPLTVRVRLSAPFAPFLTYFFETENYPILAAHVLAKTPVLAASALDRMPIGTGPYRLASWRRGEVLELRANAGYYGGEPHIQRLDVHFIASAQTIVAQLRTGEIDAAFATDPHAIDLLRANPVLRIVDTPIYGFEALSFQTTDPALQDATVRRALAAVFDFSRAAQHISRGSLTTTAAARGLFTWAYRAQPQRSVDRVALPPHLSLAIDASRPADREVAVLLQDDARRAGISLAIVPYAPQLFYAPASEHGPLEGGRYQLALHAVLTGEDPETSWLLGCAQRPPAGFNVSRYCRPAVDAALANALDTFDRVRRARDYGLVQAAVARDVPFIAAWQTREIDAFPRAMTGFSPSPETPFYRVERWRFAREVR